MRPWRGREDAETRRRGDAEILRMPTVTNGHQRSPTVTNGPQLPAVFDHFGPTDRRAQVRSCRPPSDFGAVKNQTHSNLSAPTQTYSNHKIFLPASAWLFAACNIGSFRCFWHPLRTPSETSGDQWTLRAGHGLWTLDFGLGLLGTAWDGAGTPLGHLVLFIKTNRHASSDLAETRLRGCGCTKRTNL